jgi:hypothetical protein
VHWYDPTNPGTIFVETIGHVRPQQAKHHLDLDIIDPLTVLSDSEPKLLRLLLLLTATTSPLRYHTKCI